MISRIIILNQVNACIEKTVILTDKQMHCIQIELHEMSFQNIIMKVNHEIDLELILHCKHCVLQHVLFFYTSKAPTVNGVIEALSNVFSLEM